MKKTLLLLLLTAALALTGCSASNQSYYEHAQLLLGYGDYAQAAELFTQLGEYRRSGDYALYCAALAALRDGEFTLARANFALVEDFKSSERYLRYLDALDAASAGELESALALFEALGSFEDSRERAEKLREQIPADTLDHAKSLMEAGRYEQARSILASLEGWGDSAALMAECDAAILEAAYTRAEALYASGDYASALTAFQSLGESLDAAQRAQDCLDALYRALEQDCASATLANAEELMARCEELDGYGDSAALLAALESRFRRTLNLLRDGQSRPYVLLGQYPFAESGEPQALLWRVLRLDGHEATLLCESVIDALPAASSAPVGFTQAEAGHVLSLALPTRDGLSGLGESDLSAIATPYAITQGVRHHSDGRAWWWINHTARAGRSAIVWYNGTVIANGVRSGESCVGVRPLMRLDLETLTFTGGDGSRENPYAIISSTKEGADHASDNPDPAHGRNP